MDLLDPATAGQLPGWRPLLTALRVITEDVDGVEVEGVWDDKGRLKVTVTCEVPGTQERLAEMTDLAAEALVRTCDRCGQLGRPVPAQGGCAVRCATHQPADDRGLDEATRRRARFVSDPGEFTVTKPEDQARQ